MKKLRLDVEDLRVDSFATDREDEDRGTVEGFVSRYFSCNGTCPCYPEYPDTYDCTIDTAAYTCSPCDVSGNEAYTCYAAQSCGFYTPC